MSAPENNEPRQLVKRVRVVHGRREVLFRLFFRLLQQTTALERNN